jgi:NhaP-type Na+/H+ or K+/H+ antiporter
MTLLHGPLEIIFGVLLGFSGGYIISATKIWNKRWKRTAVVLSLGLLMMFGMLRQGYSGAGAMGGLIMGMVGSVNWKAGSPELVSKRADEHYVHHAESDLALLWSLVCQPLLFGVIGSALDFGAIPVETIPKAIIVCCIGLVFRLPVAYFSTYGKGFEPKERAFIALSWIPKATVQAALCAVPLDRIKENWAYDKDHHMDEWSPEELAEKTLECVRASERASERAIGRASGRAKRCFCCRRRLAQRG